MSPVEWYYARGNQQMGPVSPPELKRLAMTGQLQPHDLVWREGLSGWMPASNVRGLFEEESAAAPKGPVAEAAPEPSIPKPPAKPRAAHLFDAILNFYRPVSNERFIAGTSKVMQACGLWGLLAAMVLSVVLAIILAVKGKDNAAGTIIDGAVTVLALMALHYLAGKFCKLLDELGRTLQGRLSSAVLPDCFAVGSKILGVIFLLLSLAVAIQSGSYHFILPGVASLLIFAYLAILAMHPAVLNISIGGEQKPGEEALGISTFLVQIVLRATPVAFGVGVLSGLALLIVAGCQMLLAGDKPEAMEISKPVMNAGRYGLYSSGLLPLGAYLVFVSFALLLNLCEGVLNLRLDRPQEVKKEEQSQNDT